MIKHKGKAVLCMVLAIFTLLGMLSILNSPETVKAQDTQPTMTGVEVPIEASQLELNVEATLQPVAETPSAPTATFTMESSPISTIDSTLAPSEAPTTEAVLDPTNTPTLEESITPTLESTITPSLEPTLELTITPTSEPTPELTFAPTATIAPAFSWKAVFIISPEQAAALGSAEYDAYSKLNASGVRYEVMDGELLLSGSESMDQLRTAIFEDISPVVTFLGGPIEVAVNSPATPEEKMEINLEARLSTGYLWNLDLKDPRNTYSEKKDPEFSQRESQVGGTSIETIHSSANVDGEGTLILNYRRPFDPKADTYAKLFIQLTKLIPVLDLTDPEPPIVIENSTVPAGNVESMNLENPIEELVQAASLPNSYDWRDYGVVPAIRNQQTCGSCWAFGTVGVMESAMKIAGAPLEDLSEQFLVSCNNEGWGCNGGLTAHAYHINKAGQNQTQIGAVLESALPYSNSNGSCEIVYAHPYKLSGWQFLTGSELTTPTVSQIKNAIYAYGPVTAGICVGANFNSYTGGIFSTDESGSCIGGEPNHQIILTGWDDSTETWVLRNSWGSLWGESGYMKIRWGTSNVGQGASWVRYGTGIPVAGIPTLALPANASISGNPNVSFQWNSAANGNKYQIEIDDLNTFASPEITNTGAAGSLTYTSTPLSAGIWYWRVRALNAFDRPGAWSTARVFTLDLTSPAAPTLSLPADNVEVRGTPVFTWLASATANAYQFAYDNDLDCPSPEYVSPIQATLVLKPPIIDPGEYHWCVKARDLVGNWSGWSTSRSITILPLIPVAPVLTGPVSALVTQDTTPGFTWNSVPYGVTYEIQIDNLATFASPIELTTTVSGTVYTPDPPLTDGLKYWRVRAINNLSENGAWSALRAITIDTTPPLPPVLYLPLVTTPYVRGTPTFYWRASVTANAYQFAYDEEENCPSPIYTSPVQAALTHKPPTMALTTFNWCVKARDPIGNWSGWSPSRSILIKPVIPVAPILASPATGTVTADTTPAFAWNPVPDGNEYEIQIDNLATFASPIELTTTISGTVYTPDPPLTDGLKYWRVRAVNKDDENGAWSTLRAITIDTTPPLPPVLYLPLATTTYVRGTPTFYWRASVTANAYQFAYDNDPDCPSPEYISPVQATLTHKPPTMALTTFNWCVKARDPIGNWSAWSPSRSILIKPVIPVAPILASPATGTVTADTTPDFAWNSVPDGDEYEIQIDNLATFAAPIELTTTVSGTIYTPDPPLTDGLKYWRVRAVNVDAEKGTWSALRAITIDTTPPLPPVLYLPLATTPYVRGTPTFYWRASVTANAYQFAYDNDPDCPSPEYISPVQAALTHKPPTMALTTFNWCVKARDPIGNWSGWSPSRSILIKPVIPVAPILASPATGTVTADTTPAFAWNPVPDGNEYEIQIDNLATFASPIELTTTISGTVYTPDPPLTDGLKYWRVRAINNLSENGAWSALRVITIDTTPPLPPVLYLPLATTPYVRGTPTFYWRASVTANAYQFAYDNDPDCPSPEYISPLQAALTHKPPTMALTTFNWCVKARDPIGNWSGWSPSRSILIKPVIPVAPILASPATGTVTDDITPNLSWNSVPDGNEYEIQIDNLATFASPIELTTIVSGTTFATTPLTSGIKYWRVRAINIDDEIGPWSLVRSFSVIVPFDSQFDGSMTNWIGIPDGQWVVDSNYLQSTRIDGNYTSAYHNSIQSDFTYQASIFKTEDTANIYDYYEFGLILRGNEPIQLSYNGFNSDYEFLINNGGYFSIWKTTNEYFLSIKPWTQTTAINKNDWNTVKVYAKGTTMVFYINNIAVYTVTGFTLPKGYVGVTMYQSAEFDETLYVNWATLGKPVAGSAPTLNASSGAVGESFPEFGHKGTPK